jgi:hypothetical protein
MCIRDRYRPFEPSVESKPTVDTKAPSKSGGLGTSTKKKADKPEPTWLDKAGSAFDKAQARFARTAPTPDPIKLYSKSEFTLGKEYEGGARGFADPDINRFGTTFPAGIGAFHDDDEPKSTTGTMGIGPDGDIVEYGLPEMSVSDATAPYRAIPTRPAIQTGELAPAIQDTSDEEKQALADQEAAALDRMAASTQGLMSRPADMIAVNEPLGKGTPIITALEKDISSNGAFNGDKFRQSINGLTDNKTFNAIVLGNQTTESGITGLTDETMYTETNVNDIDTERYKVGDVYNKKKLKANNPMVGQFRSKWRRSMIRDGVMDADGTLLNYSGTNVFDSVYAGVNGNGDFASGDGSRYKGRGLIQLTGKDNYKDVQDKLAEKGINIDLVNEPELVNSLEYALPVALAYLDMNNLTTDTASEFGPFRMGDLINSGESTAAKRDRWSRVIDNLQGQDKTNAMLSDEKEAQRIVGAIVDGIIGTNTKGAMEIWLGEQGVDVPENAKKYDLVRLVNGTQRGLN